MSKFKPKLLNELNCEVVKNVVDKYYSLIIAPDQYVNELYLVPKIDYIDRYAMILHACLWRCMGQSSVGSGGFIEYLRLTNELSEDNILNNCKKLYDGILSDIVAHMFNLEPPKKKTLYTSCKIILDMFISKDGMPAQWPKSIGFSVVNFDNIFKSLDDMLPESPKPKIKNKEKAYSLASSIIYASLNGVVLGVGSAPIYVPVIMGGGLNRNVTLIAIYKEHPLHYIFKQNMDKLLDNPEPKGNIKTTTIEIDKLFEKFKKEPPNPTNPV